MSFSLSYISQKTEEVGVIRRTWDEHYITDIMQLHHYDVIDIEILLSVDDVMT